jgi:hypothetical protein
MTCSNFGSLMVWAASLCNAQAVPNADKRKLSNAEYTLFGIDCLMTSMQPLASSDKCSGTNGSPRASIPDSSITLLLGFPSRASSEASFFRGPRFPKENFLLGYPTEQTPHTKTSGI